MSAAPGLSARIVAQVGRLRLDVQLDTGPDTLVLIGPNGSGKTSLLSLLLGVHPVERGRIEVAGTVLLDTEGGIDLPTERRRIGYVPQDYALFPHLSVRGNVRFALKSATPNLASSECERRVNILLAELGLTVHADRRPQTLSGGEKQRVALARALSVEPRALLLDEPLSALDVHSRREVGSFLGSYLRQLGLPTIVITHEPNDARRLGHRIAVLEAGRITQTSCWDELVAQPGSRFVKEFVAASDA